MRKGILVATDLGLLAYWVLTALGIVSVGGDTMLKAWNWSFLPLDLLAIFARLAASFLSHRKRIAVPLYATALALTHAAGLMALSFFVLWGKWDLPWWLVNLWLAGLPIVLVLASVVRGRFTDPKAQAHA
jgi:peptidoglycan/LPS O-acetylase OafA/YrhL